MVAAVHYPDCNADPREPSGPVKAVFRRMFSLCFRARARSDSAGAVTAIKVPNFRVFKKNPNCLQTAEPILNKTQSFRSLIFFPLGKNEISPGHREKTL